MAINNKYTVEERKYNRDVVLAQKAIYNNRKASQQFERKLKQIKGSIINNKKRHSELKKILKSKEEQMKNILKKNKSRRTTK